jgi:hypothetical protein
VVHSSRPPPGPRPSARMAENRNSDAHRSQHSRDIIRNILAVRNLCHGRCLARFSFLNETEEVMSASRRSRRFVPSSLMRLEQKLPLSTMSVGVHQLAAAARNAAQVQAQDSTQLHFSITNATPYRVYVQVGLNHPQAGWMNPGQTWSFTEGYWNQDYVWVSASYRASHHSQFVNLKYLFTYGWYGGARILRASPGIIRIY